MISPLWDDQLSTHADDRTVLNDRDHVHHLVAIIFTVTFTVACGVYGLIVAAAAAAKHALHCNILPALDLDTVIIDERDVTRRFENGRLVGCEQWRRHGHPTAYLERSSYICQVPHPDVLVRSS